MVIHMPSDEKYLHLSLNTHIFNSFVVIIFPLLRSSRQKTPCIESFLSVNEPHTQSDLRFILYYKENHSTL